MILRSKCLTAGSALAMLAAFTATAQASAIYDFEAVAATPINSATLSNLTLTNSGVTLSLSRAGGVKFDVIDNTLYSQSTPAFGARSLSGFANTQTADLFIANVSTPANGVLIQFGDFGADADSIVLTAYSGFNGTGTALATTTVPYAAGSTFPTTIGIALLSTPSINSFTFGSPATDSFPNSLLFDNISVFTPVVPEPASLGMAAVAAGLLGRRRR